MHSDATTRTKVAIVGTGFGGIGMGIRLKRAGIDSFVVLERANEIGGVWRDNTYPGAACDVPSHLYSYSFEPKASWSRAYATQPEILAYLEHCAERNGLRPHIRFGTEVVSAEWSDAASRWTLRTQRGDSIEANVVITACGQLSRPAYPRIAGMESFEGAQFHSARWDHACDLSGKRVAVIGTGASAIQFVPAIAPTVKTLHLFQRSAPYVVEKPDRVYSALETRIFESVPFTQTLDRWKSFVWAESYGPIFRARPSPATRTERMTGAAIEAFRSVVKRIKVDRVVEREIADPELRRTIAPDYPLGCKRVLISNDYYPALARENVEVVTDAIESIVERGVRTKDGRVREVDAIVYGTGFRATDFLAPMKVTGTGERDLDDAWRDGAEAYLGMSVAGFPNLFLLYGPNTNTGNGSIIFYLECQIGYVMQALASLDAHGLASIDVRPDVQSEFNARLQARLRRSVWSTGCDSWYKNEAGRVTNNWPGTATEYGLRTRRFEIDRYRTTGART